MHSLHLRVQLAQKLICASYQVKHALRHVYLRGERIHWYWLGQIFPNAIQVRQKLLIALKLAEIGRTLLLLSFLNACCVNEC